MCRKTDTSVLWFLSKERKLLHSSPVWHLKIWRGSFLLFSCFFGFFFITNKNSVTFFLYSSTTHRERNQSQGASHGKKSTKVQYEEIGQHGGHIQTKSFSEWRCFQLLHEGVTANCGWQGQGDSKQAKTTQPTVDSSLSLDQSKCYMIGCEWKQQNMSSSQGCTVLLVWII